MSRVAYGVSRTSQPLNLEPLNLGPPTPSLTARRGALYNSRVIYFSRTQRRILLGGCVSILVTAFLVSRAVRCARRANREPPAETAASLLRPVRPLPDRFPRNTHLPPLPEGRVSGSIDLGTFSPGRDLTYLEDERVWWESDSDTNDVEDDHSMHASLELPLRRLIELVDRRGARLKVQDAYRPTRIHNARSLHKEGRAVDVTCEDMPLEELAKLCWAAGFDWVYYEDRPAKGAHIHCSVRRDRNDPAGDGRDYASGGFGRPSSATSDLSSCSSGSE